MDGLGGEKKKKKKESQNHAKTSSTNPRMGKKNTKAETGGPLNDG